nr:DUF4058 family protein [Oscillochloris trichoides]
MPTPFPGMDPWLEHPIIWPDVHNRLIVALAESLAPPLRPRYYVAIEERTYLIEPGDLVFTGRADVAVVGPGYAQALQYAAKAEAGGLEVLVEMPDLMRETYLEIRASATGNVVTMLELLSPTNKRPGEGRKQYLRKRDAVVSSLTHLVEVDLLRAGEPMPMSGWNDRSDYRILISRGNKRPRSLLLPFSVRQPIPTFHLPLLPNDTEPLVDLGPLLHALYDRSGYDLRLDYKRPPEPPLDEADAAWAEELLRTAA